MPHSSSNHSLQGRKVYAAKVRHTASTGTHTAARIAHTTHTAAHITGTDTHIVAHVINKLVVYAPIKRSLRAGGITASGSAHTAHISLQRRKIYVAEVGEVYVANSRERVIATGATLRSISNETTLGRIPTHPAIAIVTATTSNRSTTSARRGYPSRRRLLRGRCGGSDRRSDELVQPLHVIGKVLPTATLLHRGRKEALVVGFKTLVVANATAISKPLFARVRVDVWPIPTYGIRWSSQRITTIRGRNYATFSHARRREAGVALTPLTATECASRRIVFVTLVIRIINLITTTRYFHIGAKRISSGHGQASLGRHTKRTKRRSGCTHAADTTESRTAGFKDFCSASTHIFQTRYAFRQATKYSLTSTGC